VLILFLANVRIITELTSLLPQKLSIKDKKEHEKRQKRPRAMGSWSVSFDFSSEVGGSLLTS
jgi:hypothetical protein